MVSGIFGLAWSESLHTCMNWGTVLLVMTGCGDGRLVMTEVVEMGRMAFPLASSKTLSFVSQLLLLSLL